MIKNKQLSTYTSSQSATTLTNQIKITINNHSISLIYSQLINNRMVNNKDIKENSSNNSYQSYELHTFAIPIA